MNKFFKTDDLQWCRKISDHEFEFIEVRNQLNPDEYDVVRGTVDVNEALNDEQIGDPTTGYYDSIDKVKEDYGDDWEQIVAECIFEQTLEVDLTSMGPYPSEDEAENEVEKMIKGKE